MTTTIALLHPGDMGAAVGACIAGNGHTVTWASQGRSASTRVRAQAASLRDRETMAQCLRDAEIVLSVCPPHGALALAREVAALGFRGVYVDANAIAPGTAREIAATIEAAGGTFVDGGIIGPPPKPGVRSSMYLSGAQAVRIAALFADSPMRTDIVEGPVGAASAVKACYAAWTKGAAALLSSIRTLAAREGVEATLLAEWEASQPGVIKRSEGMLGNARKAWRWVGEMEEIAKAYEASGLPGGFHLAAAELFRRLESFKDDAEPPTYPQLQDALTGQPRR